MRVVVRNLEVFATNKAEGGEGELADPLFGLSVLPGAFTLAWLGLGLGLST
jgi:hypothetical protein